jgi:hypothetical protein
MKESKILSAADIARERFEKYLNEKLSGAWGLEKWEFYTFLLEQAEKHPLDCSGYEPLAYQQDNDESNQHNKTAHEKLMLKYSNLIREGQNILN